MTAVDVALRPEPKRDRYGRYLIEGKPYTRVTTFAASIDDRFNLEAWKQRMVAGGLVHRPDLFAQVAAGIDDKKKLNRLCDEAVEAAKGSAGANLGTALHAFTEQIDLGLTPIIPEPWDADIAAYRDTLTASGVHIDPVFVERIIVNHDLSIAGTFDRLVTIDGWPLPVIADLKTGNLDHASAFGAIAVQLACYAHADSMYDPVTDTTTPMPDVDRRRAVVIHLPAGKATCTLYTVDIAAGWKAAQLCAAVRGWRKQKDLAAPFAVKQLPERVAWLTERVTALRVTHPEAFEDLAANWPVGVPTFKQGGHNAEHVELIAMAVSSVEARHRIPFADPDPATARPARPIVASLIDRLEQLPPDLLAAVKAAAAEAGVPNMRSHQFTVAHLEIVEDLLDAGVKAATQRTSPDVQDQRSSAA